MTYNKQQQNTHIWLFLKYILSCEIKTLIQYLLIAKEVWIVFSICRRSTSIETLGYFQVGYVNLSSEVFHLKTFDKDESQPVKWHFFIFLFSSDERYIASSSFFKIQFT